ncbi:MAG: zinc-binding dehydrogenase [Gemmatimonadetes bacterium]|jgi:NADPH:quinone reductase|nr:zinc-binding dehydrogenase [Gemmatimonadota bacterium]MBT6146538.1 zinc-binding dehydrogenase [Gemmatimonadota bacterium]MBT7862060.1 zinc-binding dehydrogenase [Gemmatimonadota bacterium]
MKRLAKPEGRYNLILEDAPMPEPDAGEVRIRAVRSLISRGSEMGARYTRDHAVSPDIMGYSMAGTIDAVGEGVTNFAAGDRVVATAPHAQYSVRRAVADSPAAQALVVALPDDVSWDAAPYYPLTSGSVTWVDAEEIGPTDTVVILGQGLVGSLMLQVMKARGHGYVIAVDALDSRCQMATDLGADRVINAAEEDPVAVVRQLTNGAGAHVVVYAVGGPAGPKAFEQGLDMLGVDGTLHLIGLYEDEPLSLPSSKIQRRRILGGYYGRTIGLAFYRRAMQLLASGQVQAQRMTTHRYAYTEAAEAFDLLWNRPGEALGVLLEWD